MDAETTALLVIDMQNDFVESGGVFEVGGIRKGLPALAAFISACRKKGIHVIYTRHEEPLGRGALENGSRGWEINGGVAPHGKDFVIDKKENDAFAGTGLDAELKKRGVRTLIITGTMTDICCASTARGAHALGYAVVFCSDLTFTSEKKAHARMLGELRWLANVLPAGEILASLKG